MAHGSCQNFGNLYPALRYVLKNANICSYFNIYVSKCKAPPSLDMFSLFFKRKPNPRLRGAFSSVNAIYEQLHNYSDEITTLFFGPLISISIYRNLNSQAFRQKASVTVAGHCPFLWDGSVRTGYLYLFQ